jgi:two-component system, OmpR family, sensor histidine kinase CiaH
VNADAIRRDDSTRDAGDARLLRRTRWRLMAWSGGATLLILLALGATLYAVASRTLAASGEAELDRRAATIERLIRGDRGFRDPTALGFAFGGESPGTFAVIVLPDGTVLRPVESRLPAGVPDVQAVEAAGGGAPDIRTMTIGTIPVRVLSVAVLRPEGQYVVQVVGDRTAETRLLGTLVTVLFGGGLVALLVALGAGYLYGGRALVPIRESILRRQDALRRQREFAANASHELRTPLTVIRASVTDLQRNRTRPVAEVGEALEDIDAEVRQLTALVDDLLILARADSGVVELARADVDLADIATETVATLGSLASARDVRAEVDPRPTPMVGDALRLSQLVTILVDNALRHTPSGSTVRVRIRPEGGPGAALMEVEDEGPGIREQDLPRVFERFWRADNAPAGGTGLGLAIAAWIVERHGGTIQVSNRPTGGALFAARFPARTDEP